MKLPISNLAVASSRHCWISVTSDSCIPRTGDGSVVWINILGGYNYTAIGDGRGSVATGEGALNLDRGEDTIADARDLDHYLFILPKKPPGFFSDKLALSSCFCFFQCFPRTGHPQDLSVLPQHFSSEKHGHVRTTKCCPAHTIATYVYVMHDKLTWYGSRRI